MVYLLLPVLQKFDAAQLLVRQKVLGIQGLGDLLVAFELPCWPALAGSEWHHQKLVREVDVTVVAVHAQTVQSKTVLSECHLEVCEAVPGLL